jgi:hypothetical protein
MKILIVYTHTHTLEFTLTSHDKILDILTVFVVGDAFKEAPVPMLWKFPLVCPFMSMSILDDSALLIIPPGPPAELLFGGGGWLISLLFHIETESCHRLAVYAYIPC